MGRIPLVSRMAALLAPVLVLLTAAPAAALFHLAHISEVMSGVNGNPALQYLEITVDNNSQHFVTNTLLTAFNCDGSVASVLLQLDHDLSDALTSTRSWLMASPDDATFFAATGIHPEFTFPGGIPHGCGMVCWGAPGVLPPAPGSWNPALLTEGNPAHKNYVDCVAYGPYTGPMLPGTGTPSGLIAGDGVHSLTRLADTDNTARDYTYSCPTPKNFDGTTGSFGDCSPVPQQPLSGKKLVLKLNTSASEKTTLTFMSKDPHGNLGGGNGSDDDPTLHPSSVRVYSVGGDHFDDTYALDPGMWHLFGQPGDNLGYKYIDRSLLSGPIKTVVVKPGKVIKVVGKGADLGHTLNLDPTPVRALLTLGGKIYCLEFGPQRLFNPDVSYKSNDSSAPPLASCLP